MDDELPSPPANQRESFPKFDIIEAKAATKRRPGSVCLFTLRDRMIGQLFIHKMLPNSLVVNYSFAYPHLDYINSEDLMRTVVVDNYVSRQRTLLVCQTCRRNCWSVYYKGHWACANCLKLYHRSQLIDKVALLWERRDLIHARVKHGRPKGMHRGTFVKLKDELRDLNLWLDGKHRTFTSEVHDQIVSSAWVSADNVDLWSPHFTVRGGQFVRV